jgi:anaerobic selenocysteine-containing dehydrogenase
VRGDKDNRRSEGYACRKGLNIKFYQHHADRLLHPLKKVGGSFERISWEQAIDEIAAKLSGIVNEHGPRSLALVMGNGSIGCPAQGPFAFNLLRGFGSQYFYTALAQELTGRYWVDGKTYGDQNLHTHPDLHETDMLLLVGWNPMMSHHTPQARRVLTKFSKDPDKVLVVVDPRLSETAKIADIHLPIRPGTDALFYRAMIAIILNEGWHNKNYIEQHVKGFEKIQDLFSTFDAQAALEVCELDYGKVKEICRLFTTRKSSHHSDLGVLLNRYSTLISYLENILRAVSGRIGIEGGNIFSVGLRGGGRSKETPDEREARFWRTVATDFPAITGVYPPNVMPEEILSDHPERLRAVIVSTANPLRSYADTSAYEQAFKRLDLLVTLELSMTETAALSHYILPARSGYESWDGGIGTGFPEIFMQIRHPVLQPEGERLEAGEIFLRLADRLGLIPEITETLSEAAESENRLKFGETLMQYFKTHPQAARSMPYILGKTLGKKLDSVHLASLWGVLQGLPVSFQEKAEREGFTPGPALGEDLFKAFLEHPEGLIVGSVDPKTWDHFKAIGTEDGRINLDVPEMADWLKEVEPPAEAERLQKDEETYPLIMSSGRHWDVNANSQMRDPEWNKGKRACTLTMHPRDAEKFGLSEGQMVKVTTEAGEETIELEVTEMTRPGYTVMPHGFGLVYQGKAYGANANRLAKNTHRDRIAGTPLHRFIRCRVEGV